MNNSHINYKKNYEKLVHSKKNEAHDAPVISEEIYQEIQKAFELFDSDSSGLIDPQLMLETFEKLNLHRERSSIYSLI